MKDTHIQIRLTTKERDRIRELAEGRGMTISRFVLERCLSEKPLNRKRLEEAKDFDTLVLAKQARGLTRPQAVLEAKRERFGTQDP